MAVAQEEFPQIYPRPGWVEHDPEAIWSTQLGTARRALESAAIEATLSRYDGHRSDQHKSGDSRNVHYSAPPAGTSVSMRPTVRFSATNVVFATRMMSSFVTAARRSLGQPASATIRPDLSFEARFQVAK